MKPLPSFLLALAATVCAAEFPEASISNGAIEARLYLPDAERGYYRGTRFDWSGVIASLRCQGHDFFDVWFPKYDPLLHDSITGPVEEFGAEDGGLGYAAAKPGETFVRIGIGSLRKPDEPAYRRFGTYEIVNPGKRTVRRERDRVEFTHEITDPSGYGYHYRKVIRLVGKEPEMRIEHTLRNTGKRPISTTQYNHNFFVIDKQPSGPGYTVTFAFEPKPVRELRGPGAIEGRRIVIQRELRDRESVFGELQGFGGTAKDYDIRVENKVAGAGVQITGDRPLAKVVFWSNPRTVCPEPYVAIEAAPGKEISWTYRYRFSAKP